MAIDFTCSCGKRLHAPDGSQGKHARCPQCGSIVMVPDLVLSPTNDEIDVTPGPLTPSRPAFQTPATGSHRGPASTRSTAATPSLARNYSAPAKSSLRRFTYFVLLLALIPLMIATFKPSEDHSDEVIQVLADHPELIYRLEHSELTESQFKAEVFNFLPDHRETGAMLAYESHAHWLLALVAAGAYFGLLLIIFPGAARFKKGLIFAGIFTGTVGVIVLLIFQFAAFHLPFVTPRGIVGLILLIVKLIGLSYSVADNPDNGVILSFFGYTCGVGLCEEITKAIPLLFRIKPTPGEDEPTWNSLLLWGLASGIGFGIAEGIMYSGRYYNGQEPAGMYLTRFVSCVALHAMWSGAVGISIYRRQGDLLNADNNWVYFFRLIVIILVPMALHGLYDTLLKKEYDAWALVVALLSFGWLALQIERQQRKEAVAA